MRGFTLLEVLISFSIAIISVSTVLWILSNSSIITRYSEKNLLEEIEKISKIVTIENENRIEKVIINSYSDPRYNFEEFKISTCYIQKFRDISYDICYLSSPSSPSKYDFTIIIINDYYFLFSKIRKNE